MATNPIGAGKVNLSVSITAESRAALGRLADQSGMKIGEYCRAVLESALENEVVYQKRAVMLAEDPKPYRTRADGLAQASRIAEQAIAKAKKTSKRK